MHPSAGMHVPPQVTEAIMRYLSERLEDPWISTADALDAVRGDVPFCSLSDREIIDLAAAKAIEAGFNISFDG